MKISLKKLLILAISLVAALAGLFVCSQSSNAETSDLFSEYIRFDAGGVISAGRSLPTRGRNVEIEIVPLLVTSGPIICTQIRWYVEIARSLLCWPELSRVINIQFSPELPHPQLVEWMCVSRDIVEGYIACVSLVNCGRTSVITLEPIDPVGVELLCES